MSSNATNNVDTIKPVMCNIYMLAIFKPSLLFAKLPCIISICNVSLGESVERFLSHNTFRLQFSYVHIVHTIL